MPLSPTLRSRWGGTAGLIRLGLIAMLVSVPTASFADGSDPSPQLIESDDALVEHTGTWGTQRTPQASGGTYRFSGGSPDDGLMLEFIGTTLAILYVEGPQMGIMAVEVDGVVLRSVMTGADRTAYPRRAVFDYLTDEAHTLRVYASQGVIGVDAFIAVPNDGKHPEVEAASVPRASPCGSDDLTHRVSIATDGAQGNAASWDAALSGDGRFVVFDSEASNLVSGDSNGEGDVFVRDRIACTTVRASVATDGTQGNNSSGTPSISDDGRYVAFVSSASSLVSSDTNNAADVFVRDLTTGTTTRVSVATGGTQVNGHSGGYAVISPDGQHVVFSSLASDLVGGDTNNIEDLFVHDRTAGTTTRVSVASDGTQSSFLAYNPDISADGRYVSFMSHDPSLVGGDTNGRADIFVRDLTAGTTTLASVASDGTQANDHSEYPGISGDGRYVVFDSWASNLVSEDTNGAQDTFVHDRTTGVTTRVSVTSDGTQANGLSRYPTISTDGRYVAFYAIATNLINVPTYLPNVYIHDRTTSATSIVSIGVDGAPSEFGLTQWYPAISGDGHYVAFSSIAANLVIGDTNWQADIFVHDTFASPSGPLPPSGLSATTFSSVQINLQWTDNSPTETNYGIERSLDGVSDWSQIGSTGANTVTFSDTVWIGCATTYYYRVRAFRSGDGLFSTYSNIASATTLPCSPAGTDGVMLVRPSNNTVYLRNNLADPPPSHAYGTFTAQPPAPALNGQWVMGDWDGNGNETLGIYASNGVFYYTNTLGTTTAWNGIWIGLFNRPPVAGRFNAGVNHDCIGVVDRGEFPPYGTAFALYFTCDLTNGTAPTLIFQWLSVLLPDSQGHSGTFQFTASDFDGNTIDSIAARRGAYIAWTNVPPTVLLSEFSFAQYIGTPAITDEGQLLAGDWNQDGVDSFGLYYQTGYFYRREDLQWNSGSGVGLSLGTPLGTPSSAVTWH